MKILAIDTATELCSVALSLDSRLLVREIETDRGHAAHLLPMIDELLSEAGVALHDVDAIAFGRGPGGFTGVRLAASVAQGLAFGAGLSVVPVSDLRAVAQRAFELDAGLTRVLVCNDARMHEIYWACFARAAPGLALLQGDEHVGPASQVRLPAGWNGVVAGVGRGFRIYPELAHLVGMAYDDLLPRAAEIAKLALPEIAAGRSVPPEQAIPVYLRDDVARPSS
jgi:tRNA threonylcarbamoyladenosine biosynthesis protein TsaB